MKRKKAKRKTLKSVRNLISITDYAEFIGTAMVKWGVRSTVAAGALGGLMYGLYVLSGAFELRWGLSLKEACRLPKATGFIVLIPGALMKYGCRFFSATNITLAEAADLNLVKDLRKSEIAEQLRILWARVFKWEAALQHPQHEIEAEAKLIPQIRSGISNALQTCLNDEQLAYLGVERSEEGVSGLVDALCAARPFSNGMEKSEAAFIDSSRWALEHPQNLEMQEAEAGFDLRQLEDFRDAGYFQESDVKMIQQYFGNPWIAAAKKEIGSYGWRDLALQPAMASQNAWFKFITRTLSGRLGAAVKLLREKYGRKISVEHLMWPGVEDDPALCPEASEALLDSRIRILRGIFGQTLEEADAMLERMLFPIISAITHLRMRFDPEYCDGGLGYELVSDLIGFQCRDEFTSAEMAFARKTKADQHAFVQYIEEHRPELLKAESAADLRVARIALHVNRNGMKDCLLTQTDRSANLEKEIDAAIEQRGELSRMLLAVRMQHTLAIVQWYGYQNLLTKLAYANEE